MKIGAVIAALGACAVVVVNAQSRTFEVISVKPNPSRTGIRGHAFPGDRFVATNVPVRDLILTAYGEPGKGLPDSMQRGGPDWVDSDRFDVSAKVAAGEDPSVAHKQILLRGLLADRFKLKVHIESVESPIYVMTLMSAGEPGKGLHPTNDVCGDGDAGSVPTPRQPGQPLRCVLYVTPPGSLFARGQTMPDFAYALTRTLGRTVQDRTGLSGSFDAEAQFNPEGLPGWAPLPANAVNHDAASLFEMLRQEFGLKLEGARAPVDILVIDHIERPAED